MAHGWKYRKPLTSFQVRGSFVAAQRVAKELPSSESPAALDGHGKLLTPAFIGSTLPEVFEDVQAGDSIWFDDGRIGGLVERIEPDRVTVKITHARERGGNLFNDKGINLPDSPLRLPALTPEDVADLEFIVKYADIGSLSFANSAADIDLLHEHLNRLGGERLGVMGHLPICGHRHDGGRKSK